MASPAYWIDPAGRIIGTGHHRHVGVIIRYPETFGVTADQVQRLYDKYREPLGVEGRARDELIYQALERGFFHIRERRNHWNVTVHRLTPEKRRHLMGWAREAATDPLLQQYAEVIIRQAGERAMTTRLDAILAGELTEGETDGSTGRLVQHMSDFGVVASPQAQRS